MGAKLLYRDAQGRDASVDIVADGVFLGRGADCAVRTDDAMVSRKNCKISFQAGRWTVEDLGSSNGTFVNETRVQKHGLAHADVIRCGSLQVRFVETADAVGKPKTMSLDVVSPRQPSIQVSPELTGPLDPANLMALKDNELQTVVQERDALAQRLQEVAPEFEALQARNEMDQSELKKLRGEAVQARERLSDLGRQKSLQDEELHAQHKLSEEMRQELAQLREGYHTEKAKAEELAEEMAARDRQLERAQDDMARAKTLTEELRNAMSELQKTKDEGWRELNTRVGELDNLREVISEQERILEERRVGLISLESSVKEMRQDREKALREMVQMKTERDQLRENCVKLQAHVDGLEEEHRRLARAMADTGGSGGGGGGGGGSNDEYMRVAKELREMKVEVKKLENDRSRLTEQTTRLEAERKELDDKHAKVDVERNTLREQKAGAEAARSRVEEALAKAETARQRAEEERVKTVAARDAALASTDELRKEIDSERKRAGELEDQLAKTQTQLARAAEGAGDGRNTLTGATSPGMAAVSADFTDEPTGAGGTHPDVDAAARIHELEEELAKLATELALAQQAAVAPAPAGNGAQAAAAGGHDVQEIKRRAGDAYTGINDALSELRTNILLAKDLVTQHGPTVPDADAVRTLEEAIQVSMDRTEDAKGLLRSLREVVET